MNLLSFIFALISSTHHPLFLYIVAIILSLTCHLHLHPPIFTSDFGLKPNCFLSNLEKKVYTFVDFRQLLSLLKFLSCIIHLPLHYRRLFFSM